MELLLPSLPYGRGKQGGAEVGDDTWVPLGSGYGRVKGVLAWASCWAAFVGRLGGP